MLEQWSTSQSASAVSTLMRRPAINEQQKLICNVQNPIFIKKQNLVCMVYLAQVLNKKKSVNGKLEKEVRKPPMTRYSREIIQINSTKIRGRVLIHKNVPFLCGRSEISLFAKIEGFAS